MDRTNSKIDTLTARGDSRRVHYELVRADGEISPMKFDTAAQAVEAAGYLWPEQHKDPDRTGAGWDVQMVRI